MSYETPPGGQSYAPPNSSLALLSMIAGILGLTFIPLAGSVVALVTGYMAKKEIRESGGALGGDGLATAGLVLGWIGVALGVLGLCLLGLVLAIPLCLIPLNIMQQDFYWLAPAVFSALF